MLAYSRPMLGAVAVQQNRYCMRVKLLRFSRFAEVRFASRVNGGRNRILLASSYILAALDQFVRAFAKFACLALRVIPAFIGLLGKKIACFIARFGREQNSD